MAPPNGRRPPPGRNGRGRTSLEHSPNRVSRWLRPPAAGAYLGGVSTSTLAKWRLAGTGPAYSKVGRLIVYDIAELDSYLASRRRLSTSDTGQEG